MLETLGTDRMEEEQAIPRSWARPAWPVNLVPYKDTLPPLHNTSHSFMSEQSCSHVHP